MRKHKTTGKFVSYKDFTQFYQLWKPPSGWDWSLLKHGQWWVHGGWGHTLTRTAQMYTPFSLLLNCALTSGSQRWTWRGSCSFLLFLFPMWSLWINVLYVPATINLIMLVGFPEGWKTWLGTQVVNSDFGNNSALFPHSIQLLTLYLPSKDFVNLTQKCVLQSSSLTEYTDR